MGVKGYLVVLLHYWGQLRSDLLVVAALPLQRAYAGLLAMVQPTQCAASHSKKCASASGVQQAPTRAHSGVFGIPMCQLSIGQWRPTSPSPLLTPPTLTPQATPSCLTNLCSLVHSPAPQSLP